MWNVRPNVVSFLSDFQAKWPALNYKMGLIRHININRKLRNIYILVAFLTGIVLPSGCDVHEWPDATEHEYFALNLVFETDLPQWEHTHSGRSRSGSLPVTLGMRDYGLMRYTIRAYPLVGGVPEENHSYELTFTRDIVGGYDCTSVMHLPVGSYRIMVWSDLNERDGDAPFYNIDDFREISLQGEHSPNNDYRDAFRGVVDVTIDSYTVEHDMQSSTVVMQRPLAKFEFVTTDLIEFFDKEARASRDGATTATDDSSNPALAESSRAPSLDDYTVVFHYIGYMPSSYSMVSDKPVDSRTGVKFNSTLTRLNDEEATMGFDHVFVNGSQTAVTVQLELFNKEGEQVSLTDPIEVPLKRSMHTVVRGSFLMMESTGGMGIDPGYTGDFNLFL